MWFCRFLDMLRKNHTPLSFNIYSHKSYQWAELYWVAESKKWKEKISVVNWVRFFGRPVWPGLIWGLACRRRVQAGPGTDTITLYDLWRQKIIMLGKKIKKKRRQILLWRNSYLANVWSNENCLLGIKPMRLLSHYRPPPSVQIQFISKHRRFPFRKLSTKMSICSHGKFVFA